MVGLTITHSSVEPTSGVSEIGSFQVCPSSNASSIMLFWFMISNNVRILCFVAFGKVGKLVAASGGADETLVIGRKKDGVWDGMVLPVT